MKLRSSLLLLCFTTLLLSLAAPRLMTQTINSSTPDYITKALSDYGRMPNDTWEDPTTKPAEVLKYIGVKPGDKVVDLLPGNRHVVAMYWSRIFYRVVGDTGKVYPFIPAVGCRAAHLQACVNERNGGSSTLGYAERPPETNMGDPRWNGIDEALDVEHTTNFRNLYTIWAVAGQFSIPEQVDVVWSTAHYHDFHAHAYQINMTTFLGHVFESIKNNGEFIIADYAGNPGTGFTQVDNLHRVDKEAVKAEVLKAGFVFDGESNLWAVPTDDHTRGVVEEITPGKADMFILKFKKPGNAPPPRRSAQSVIAGWYNASWSPANTPNSTGGIWYSPYFPNQAIGPYEEYPEFYGTWFVDAADQICIRHEYPPLAQGILGIHELYHKKLGDVWANTNNNGAAGQVTLRTQHNYPQPPGSEAGGRGGRGRGPIGDPEGNWNDPSWGYIK